MSDAEIPEAVPIHVWMLATHVILKDDGTFQVIAYDQATDEELFNAPMVGGAEDEFHALVLAWERARALALIHAAFGRPGSDN